MKNELSQRRPLRGRIGPIAVDERRAPAHLAMAYLHSAMLMLDHSDYPIAALHARYAYDLLERDIYGGARTLPPEPPFG